MLTVHTQSTALVVCKLTCTCSKTAAVVHVPLALVDAAAAAACVEYSAPAMLNPKFCKERFNQEEENEIKMKYEWKGAHATSPRDMAGVLAAIGTARSLRFRARSHRDQEGAGDGDGGARRHEPPHLRKRACLSGECFDETLAQPIPATIHRVTRPTQSIAREI